MNVDRDLDRRLTDLYASEADLRAPDRVLGATLTAIDTTPQRRWLVRVPWRLPKLNGYARLAVVAAVVIAVGAIGLALFRPPGTSPGALVNSSPFPSPAPSPTPSPTRSPPRLPDTADPLEPGRYQLASGFPVGVSFDVPAGTVPCSHGPLEQALCGQAELSFLFVENVVADPCSETLLDPPVGPTVDDLVEAVSNLKGFTATAPVDVTVGGHPARQFEVVAPSNPSCDLKTWATRDRVNGVGADESNLLWIVDVDGARVLIAGASSPRDASDETRAAFEEIVNSIQFDP